FVPQSITHSRTASPSTGVTAGAATGGRETTSDGGGAAPSPSAPAGSGTTGGECAGTSGMRGVVAAPRVARPRPHPQGQRRLLTRRGWLSAVSYGRSAAWPRWTGHPEERQ